MLQKMFKRGPPFYIFRHYATYRRLQKKFRIKIRKIFFHQFLVFREILLSKKWFSSLTEPWIWHRLGPFLACSALKNLGCRVAIYFYSQKRLSCVNFWFCFKFKETRVTSSNFVERFEVFLFILVLYRETFVMNILNYYKYDEIFCLIHGFLV